MKRQKNKVVYEITPLFKMGDGAYTEGEGYRIVGSLKNYKIVSVPVSTTLSAAQELTQKISKALNCNVLVVTHNTCFLTATRVKQDRVKQAGGNE